MSVDKVSLSVPICMCSNSDYEALAIIRRLRELGIEPTGDKQANKAKLHEIEIRIAKSRNEPLGGLLTVSGAKEQEIINHKKENLYGSIKNYQKQKGNKDILKEDEIYGRQTLAIIELKRREAKDKAKSDKLKLDKPSSKVKYKKEVKETTSKINPQISPDYKSDKSEKTSISTVKD